MSRHQLLSLLNVALSLAILGILIAVLVPAEWLGSANAPLRRVSERESWLIHGTLFASLSGVVGLRLLAAAPSQFTRGWILLAVVLIAALATGTELAQLRVHGRDATPGDWLADLTGMWLGLGTAALIGPTLIAWLTSEPAR
ncbi:MAG: VanZ family protein [Chloroflexi bacterium]|nr:VanZ family protein [Chloroflexota bacterium]MDA1146573.1 VanZ family protein [Chloroflexota bacterium]MQC82737.1 hypothetical protein [Chloroflexota bacterium]